MRRTPIIIASAIVLLALIVVGLFFYFSRSPGVAVDPGGTTSLPLVGQPGTDTGGNTSTGGTPTVSSPGSPVVVSNRLVQISKGPVVAGAVVTSTKTSSSSPSSATVTYIERQSGNVFAFSTGSRTLTRINNKTLPGIQSASWLPDASMALVQYLSGTDLSTINTYALAASSSQGYFLAQNLSSVAVSPTQILTVASGVNGSVASLKKKDGSNLSTLFSTPLTSIRASFAGKDRYLVFTKPSASLTGSAFLVSGSGHFARIAGPLSGLSALASPSGKTVLISYTENSVMRMQLVNTASGAITPLPVATIADKCVWTQDETSIYCGVSANPPQALYPDDWYQGAVRFSDRIWNIHVADRYAQMVLDFPASTDSDLDASALAIDPAQTTLVFRNKNDDSLWSYQL